MTTSPYSYAIGSPQWLAQQVAAAAATAAAIPAAPGKIPPAFFPPPATIQPTAAAPAAFPAAPLVIPVWAVAAGGALLGYMMSPNKAAGVLIGGIGAPLAYLYFGW